MKLRFTAQWSADWHRDHNVPKGFLLLKYDQFYRKAISSAFRKLDAFQEKKKEGTAVPDEYLRPLEVNIEIYYKKRTLDQNALMWALYEIMANEMNGGHKGAADQTITTMELYLNDLDEWGEREQITTKRKNLNYYVSEYRIIEKITHNDNDYTYQQFINLDIDDLEIITIQVVRGTSMLDTREMAEWINNIFNRLAYYGVSLENSSAILRYWKDWRESINDNKIILNDTIMTRDEYKAYNPICEACGAPVMHGAGELAHIQGFGMGGDRTAEPTKNYTSNWLHLCTVCHRDIWHGTGWKQFLKQFKHLTYKVVTALNREYKNIL